MVVKAAAAAAAAKAEAKAEAEARRRLRRSGGEAEARQRLELGLRLTCELFDSPSRHSDCKACSSLRRRAFASSSESSPSSAHTGARFLTRLTRRGESSVAGRACRPVAPRRQSTRVATCSCIRFARAGVDDDHERQQDA